MRTALTQTLVGLAQRDPRIILATGDLGFKVLDEFREKCPRQFLNMGVAEASLIGMATGLALEGKIPVCYSIAPFLTMRPFEQIRNDVCFHNANVKLVGLGGGFSYGPNGPSHHALNDVALMRSLPEMTVLTPGDEYEAQWAIEAACAHAGPVYIRLGRSGEGKVHEGRLRLKIGQSMELKQGSDVAILASGLMLTRSLEVARILDEREISVRLISFPSVKPLDKAVLSDVFERCGQVFTLEEHGIAGGFGSAVAELALSSNWPTGKLHILGVPAKTYHQCGDSDYLRGQAGLSTTRLVSSITNVLKKNYVN